MNTCVHTDTCTETSMAALLTVAPSETTQMPLLCNGHTTRAPATPQDGILFGNKKEQHADVLPRGRLPKTLRGVNEAGHKRPHLHETSRTGRSGRRQKVDQPHVGAGRGRLGEGVTGFLLEGITQPKNDCGDGCTTLCIH